MSHLRQKNKATKQHEVQHCWQTNNQKINPPLPSSSTAQNEIPSGNQASSLSQGRSKLTSQNDVFQNGVYSDTC
jgi:hypothetical protein